MTEEKARKGILENCVLLNSLRKQFFIMGVLK